MSPCLLIALLSTITANELVDRSIAYHDPDGRWGRGAFEITDVSSGPDGSGRRTVLRFDNGRGRFEMESTVEGRPLSIVVQDDKTEVRLDGSTDLSSEVIERYRLAPAQLLRKRNFYLYLYGLPMKLRDPGTRLDPKVKETTFGGKAVYELRVTYDKTVGTDTWYFYLDRVTYALVGHRFHHDEAARDGEHTVFSDEISGEGLRLPRVRKWYRNQGDEWFITHTIQSVAACCATTRNGDAERDFVTPDGVRLRYRVTGNASSVVVLLHGGPGSNFNAVWPDLTPLAKTHKVVMYDQRGGGRSDVIRDASRLTADDHVRDLEALREHLRLERLTIIGESWGSGLALLYATRHPDRVERIVFLGPMPPTKAMMTRRFDRVNETTDFYRRLAEMRRAMPTAEDPVALCRAMFAEYLKAYFVDPGAMARRRGSSCDAPAEGVRNYQVVNDATFKSLGEWDFRPLLAKLEQPTLVIEGAGSAPTLESVRAWAAALPNTELVLIPNAGHYPQVENPEAFFPVVERFLSGR